MEGDFRKVFSAPVNRLTAAIRLTWQILSAWVNRWTVAAIAITIVILAIVAKENFLYLLSICSMPFVVIIVSIMVSLAAKKHPRGTESKGQIFVYPHFIRKFFWVFFFIIVALLGFVLFDNYPKNEVRDLVTVLVVTGILFLGCVFLSWAAKVEYLEVSADGDTLTNSGV